MGFFDVFKKRSVAQPQINPGLLQKLNMPMPPNPPKNLPGADFSYIPPKAPAKPVGVQGNLANAPEMRPIPEPEPIKLPDFESIDWSKFGQMDEEMPTAFEKTSETVNNQGPKMLPMQVMKEPVPQATRPVENKGGSQPIEMNSVSRGPVFIMMDTYQEFMESINDIGNSLRSLDVNLARNSELRDKEAGEFRRWQYNCEELRKRLLFVDDMIFETRR